jgi:hypothetical protein
MDVDKLIVGAVESQYPLIKVLKGDEIKLPFQKEAEEIAERIGQIFGLFESLLLPQQKIVMTRTETIVTIPEKFHYEDDETQPIYRYNPAAERFGQYEPELVGYHKKKVIDSPATKEIRYGEEVEDSVRSFILSTWHAFKIWSSIPILQFGTVIVIIATFLRISPLLVEQVLKDEGILHVATKRKW